MQWHEAGGKYVAQPWDAGTPPAQADTLQELFALVDARRREEHNRREMQQVLAEREARIRDLQRRVSLDLGLPQTNPTHRRGAPAAVVVLYRVHPRTRQPWYTPIDVKTGLPLVYRTVTAAARTLRTKPDNICQAIRRGGVCGGLVFAYVSDLPDRHVCARAMAQLQPRKATRSPARKLDELDAFREAILCN